MEQINRRRLNWASILEDNLHERAVRTATMLFAHPPVALPDAQDLSLRRTG